MASQEILEERCEKCNAVKISGIWTRSPFIIAESMMEKIMLLPKGLCGECSGKGLLWGGFPRTSNFMPSVCYKG